MSGTRIHYGQTLNAFDMLAEARDLDIYIYIEYVVSYLMWKHFIEYEFY